MPRQSQFKVLILVFVLAVLTIYYVINGARDTKQSLFYTRTVAAIEAKKSAAAREEALAEEKHRNGRVEEARKQHEAAMSQSGVVLTTSETTNKPLVDNVAGPKNQNPILADPKGAGAVPATATETERSVAGRKKIKDDKVVEGKPAKDLDDGVAKVGNIGSQATSALKNDKTEPETEEDHKIEVELNDILKKGPLIVFSKSYCPYSKKAKHILQDLYTITPPPYVVELDEHPLGVGLQAALAKTTGRRTVPNILVNGRSIGGGDDIAELHESGKLAEKLQSLGGKRITSVIENPASGDDEAKPTKKAQKFKA